jgi:hypothetical protein
LEIIVHLDSRDPLRVLEAELGRGAQAQRKSERIACIFGRQNSLRMQRRGYAEAFE